MFLIAVVLCEYIQSVVDLAPVQFPSVNILVHSMLVYLFTCFFKSAVLEVWSIETPPGCPLKRLLKVKLFTVIPRYYFFFLTVLTFVPDNALPLNLC